MMENAYASLITTRIATVARTAEIATATAKQTLPRIMEMEKDHMTVVAKPLSLAINVSTTLIASNSPANASVISTTLDVAALHIPDSATQHAQEDALDQQLQTVPNVSPTLPGLTILLLACVLLVMTILRTAPSSMAHAETHVVSAIALILQSAVSANPMLTVTAPEFARAKLTMIASPPVAYIKE